MAVERMRRGNGPQLSVEHLSLDIRDDCTLNHPSHHSTRAGPLPLVDIDETPTYLRRPYILRGYRVSYTFWRCVQSVWSVHNESGNIWTHALGFVYFAWLLAACGSEDFATVADSYMCVLYCVGVCICMLLSSMFHTFNCQSPDHSQCWFRLDQNGINVQFLVSYIPGLYYGFMCYPGLQKFYVVVIAAHMAAAFFVANTPRCRNSPSFTKVYNALMIEIGAFALIPIGHWYCLASKDEVRLFIPEMLKTLVLYGLGVIFFLSRYPEKAFPGVFDYAFSSHQIWHVFVFAAAFKFYQSLQTMMRYRDTTQCGNPGYVAPHGFALTGSTPTQAAVDGALEFYAAFRHSAVR